MGNEQRWDDVSRLVVGGHSFISELGNDPAIDFDTQLMIVNECLDQGINCFDTTYEPERIALGGVLEALGRRGEAKIIAWNFFTDNASGEYLVRPKPFEVGDIELLLEQLRTDYIDMLVVHPAEGGEEDKERQDKEQLEIAKSWLAAGYVGSLGTWGPGDDVAERFAAENAYDFMVMAKNIRGPAASVFSAGKAIGWRTFATSAFGRGWLLDQLFAIAGEDTSQETETVRARIADALLRFSLHDPHVDHLIVGIRKKEWISINLESVSMGPLSEEERRWLFELLERAETRNS